MYLDRVNDRDLQVLAWHVGADGQPRTYGEIAEAFGISRERVRQLRNKAARCLRKDFAEIREQLEQANVGDSYMELARLECKILRGWFVAEAQPPQPGKARGSFGGR